MHSTLLELDTVAEVERKARGAKRANLAWEDPNTNLNHLEDLQQPEDNLPADPLELPVPCRPSTMEFQSDSEFGNCLLAMGRAGERVSGIQESFVNEATATWLESLEGSLAMTKEYQCFVIIITAKGCKRRQFDFKTAFLNSKVPDGVTICDGKNTDSPDHKSHAAYPTSGTLDNNGPCPATHPVRIQGGEAGSKT
ncbi:hypothetical protein B0T26DRAFT_806844 [Lasiosphaeria miniovina]|uniref:DUF1996 domain-containing protein n=1 Tax=Lasiosphaeria miniovina TaxID=1954250 RepID=A0AA40DGY1_9PEZI|nr:uncharacterized protein B0T26DRAFT_806844 [Lasiosphaeria miniovina]KAK0703099.1 hypothetical protein B0T26DRAFT_806844 [Lasiosphaeria miniovina]